MRTVLAFVVSLHLPLVVQTQQEPCYWQNGNVADGQAMCQGTDGSCCDPIDACFTNGLCMSTQGFLYQGACTIQGWGQGTVGCFSKCDASAYTIAPLSPCIGDGPARLCCGWANEADTCCRNENGGFTFDFPIFNGRLNNSLFANIIRSAEASGIPRAATATTMVTTTAAATSAANGCVENSVPIGIGVALGVALLIAVGIIVLLLIKLKRQGTVPAGTADDAQQNETVEAGSYPRPYEVQHHPRFEVQGNDVPELGPVS